MLGYGRLESMSELPRNPDFPWKLWDNGLASDWSPFIEWYRALRARDLLWEGSKILRLLSSSLSIRQVAELMPPENLNSIIESADGLKPSEPALFTALAVANDIFRHGLDSFHKDGSLGTRGLMKVVTPYFEVATTIIELIFGSEPKDSEGRLVIQWKLEAEQMRYLRNAGIINHYDLQPQFVELELAAVSLGDIRLQAELIPAVCLTGSDNNSPSGTLKDIPSPIPGADWDITLLATPLHALLIPSSNAGLQGLKKILRYRTGDIGTTQAEVWNFILAKADQDRQYELLLRCIQISAEDDAQELENSAALQLALKLLNRSPDLALRTTSDHSSIFRDAAKSGATAGLDVALSADRRRVEALLNTRDLSGRTPLDYAIDNKQYIAIIALVRSGYKIPLQPRHLFEILEYADLNVTRLMAETFSMLVDGQMIRKAIENGRSDIAIILIENCMQDNFESDGKGRIEWERLLSIAVQARQPDVVELLVSKYPESTLKSDENDRSVLWYNKPLSSDEDPKLQQKIRDIIAPVIIRNASIAEAKRALHEAGELFLDLGAYDDAETFWRFMDSISKTLDASHEKPLIDIEFESTLKYVIIDIPDTNVDLNSLFKTPMIRDEVGRIFQWLSLDKNVRKIIELTVADSGLKPQREDQIVDAIKKFDVEILDWKTGDLSIDCILDAAPNVEQLHLYTSTWNSLCQWTSSEGAIILPKLQTLRITIYQNILGKALATKYLQKAEERMNHVLKLSSKQIYFEIKLYQVSSQDRSPLDITQLGPFLEGYSSLQRFQKGPFTSHKTSRLSRTKIAILDDGINQTSPVWTEVNKAFAGFLTGASFVVNQKQKESPWWLSRTSHGTQLASVICMLDPFCHLFIAKMIDSMENLDPQRTISAIEWAMERNVDIIIIDTEIPKPAEGKAVDALRLIIRKAISNGINFIVSMRDDLWFYEESSRGFIEVANYTGQKQLGRIFCEGDNVSIPGLVSEDPEPKISPSSAATAITAGVASLIIATQRLVQFSIDPKGSTPDSSVAKFQGIMEREMGGRKCLKPWRWFGEKAVYEIDKLRSIVEETHV